MVDRRMFQVLTVTLLVAAGAGCNIALPTQATPREPLDALWEKHMLEGRGVRIWLDDQWQPSTVHERGSFLPLLKSYKEGNDPKSYQFRFRDPYGITILRHVEGYWRNGGWTLTGGLLGIAQEPEATIELFGKAIIRTSVHVPAGIFHLDPPSETGYEFFLLQRSKASGIAVIIQRWIVPPDDVVLNRDGYPHALAALKYEPSRQIATVTITGIKHAVSYNMDVATSRAR
jgi:hypothetical protein